MALLKVDIPNRAILEEVLAAFISTYAVHVVNPEPTLHMMDGALQQNAIEMRWLDDRPLRVFVYPEGLVFRSSMYFQQPSERVSVMVSGENFLFEHSQRLAMGMPWEPETQEVISIADPDAISRLIKHIRDHIRY